MIRRLPGTNKLVLFWNNSKYVKGHHHLGERTPLTAAVSSDAGKTWKIIGRIGEGEMDMRTWGQGYGTTWYDEPDE